MRVSWCYWNTSSYFRRDHAFVAQPHNEAGEPVATYWLAWPPFIESHLHVQVQRRRFKSSMGAMRFVDANWPIDAQRKLQVGGPSQVIDVGE